MTSLGYRDVGCLVAPGVGLGLCRRGLVYHAETVERDLAAFPLVRNLRRTGGFRSCAHVFALARPGVSAGGGTRRRGRQLTSFPVRGPWGARVDLVRGALSMHRTVVVLRKGNLLLL